MPKFETKHPVAHSPEKMFALVADVERYPEFLPMCEALTVRSRRERDGRTALVADMTVGYRALHETFTSMVFLKPAERAIDVRYADGPFRRLENRWRFPPQRGSGCEVCFHIDYEFKNRMLGAVMNVMFERGFRLFAEAFERRADQIYGTSGGPEAITQT